jgi:hypothetical protein
LEENQRRAKAETATAPIRKAIARGRPRKSPTEAQDQEGLF